MSLKFLDTENKRIKISLWEINPKVKKEKKKTSPKFIFQRQNIFQIVWTRI